MREREREGGREGGKQRSCLNVLSDYVMKTSHILLSKNITLLLQYHNKKLRLKTCVHTHLWKFANTKRTHNGGIV